MTGLKLIKRTVDFDKFRGLKPYHSSSLTLRYRLMNQNFPRFGFIVSKKQLPKVTDRNKVKRRLKDLASRSSTRLRSVDILVLVRKTALRKNYSELKTELESLLKQARLWA